MSRERAEALRWLEELPQAGLEDLVCKGAAQSYQGGTRQSLKVKSRNVVDVVLVAVIGPMTQPRAGVIGMPMKGRLRIIGRSTALTATAARELAAYLRALEGSHPWPEELSDTMLDRSNKESGTIRLTLVDPIVVQVSADLAWSGHAFRHSVRLVRVRPELDRTTCNSPTIWVVKTGRSGSRVKNWRLPLDR